MGKKTVLFGLLLVLMLASMLSTPALEAPTPGVESAESVATLPPPTLSPPTSTPQPLPTAPPTPAPVRVRVGIQAGHWRTEALPREQAHMRGSAGAMYKGVLERDINLRLARRVVAILEKHNIQADLLPATVPAGYQADAFVSIHADYAPAIPERRGYKVGTPWRSSPASFALQDALNRSFSKTEQPHHNAVNGNMRGYFGFNYLRYTYAIAPTTPAVLIETGFITNKDDLLLLTTGHEQMAETIATGILAYLAERDPTDLAALQPPDLPLVTPLAPIKALLTPHKNAPAVQMVRPGDLLWTYDQREGWYRVVLPPDWDFSGWVRVEAVKELPADAFRHYGRSP